jgi:uncharacterized protein with PIN domain
MPNLEAQDRSPIEQRESLCPNCGTSLVPVYTLPEEKIRFLQQVEIDQQLYCQPCDRRFSIEEVWRV